MIRAQDILSTAIYICDVKTTCPASTFTRDISINIPSNALQYSFSFIICLFSLYHALLDPTIINLHFNDCYFPSFFRQACFILTYTISSTKQIIQQLNMNTYLLTKVRLHNGMIEGKYPLTSAAMYFIQVSYTCSEVQTIPKL